MSDILPSAGSKTLLINVYTAESRAATNPLALLRMLATHRELIWQMAKREVAGRYRGSAFGLMWSFFHPLLMLGVYTFAFAYVLQVRVTAHAAAGTGGSGVGDFAVYAFSGLILMGLFMEVITRAPVFITQNANYVKKVIFPLEIFPFVYLLSALIHAAISMAVLLVVFLAVDHTLPGGAITLLAPIALVPLALLVLGVAWFLAGVGVYLRDVAQSIGIVTTMLMYLSPVFYALESVQDERLRLLIRFNPLTVPLISFRRMLLEGRTPEWDWLGGYALVSVVVAWAGFAFFQRARKGFADVL